MWEKNSVNLEIETGFTFKPHTKNIFAETFINQSLNQDSDESAILKIKYYNPLDLLFQHLPNKEKVRNIEVNQMRSSYVTDTLPSVDNQEIVKIGGKVYQIY